MIESAFTTIITNARSLSECCNFGERTQANQYLENWCQVVAQGDWETFRKRLQWDGIEIDIARSSPSSVAVAEKETLPDWATTLKDIIATASQWQSKLGQPQLLIANDTLPLSIHSENPLPFEDLLLPLIHVARQKLLAHLNVDLCDRNLLLEVLLPEAYLKLERSLLISLANFCDKTLEKEFYHFRPFGYRLLSFTEIKTELEPKTTYYQAFVKSLLQDGLLTFFQKYPVLGKLIATRIDFWVESTAEFLQRLKTDIPEIQQMFQPEQKSEKNLVAYPLGKVTEIKANLSDPHQRGRCVIGLTFKSGLKLIYKPKNLGLDLAYQQLLEWFNQQNAPLAFKTLKVLNRSNYGWVEYVEQSPVEDELAAQRFYQRSGMLLCLFYVLNTTDCHYENLIACGEHLVLIDMETLIHHDARDMEESLEKQLQTSADHLLNESVLRSGLLPRWGFNKNEPAPYDISGLGSIDADAALSDRVLVWKLINTDNMHRAYETVSLPPEKNVPMLNGIPLSPNQYLDEIVAGFRQMYRFLIQHRKALLAENSPLASFSGQQVRFVFRATKAYAVILQSLLEPEYLQNGCDRSIELDILSRVFLTCQNQPSAWSILSSELQAMEQSDIPYFAAKSDSDALTVGLEQPLSGYFKAPCYAQVISRLLELDETDLIRQVAIIRGSFYARAARLLHLEESKIAKTAEEQRSDIATVFEQPGVVPSTHLTSHPFLTAAYDIAAKICSHAIEDTSGNISWIGLSYVPTAERFQLQVINEGFYDGKCGVALFLTALDSLNGSSKFRHWALGALQSTRQILQIANREPTQKRIQRIGIGGASGLGSVIYSLTKISQFLKEDFLLEDALNAANLITAELISTDKQLDVAAGVSGAILGLLALYDQTANSAVLSKAIACGQHLLSAQVNLLGSPKAWKLTEARPLPGFLHSASGIAYALLRLYSVTDDRAYLEAIYEGIADDSLLIDRSSGCHDCAGMLLARLGIGSILKTEAIHQDGEAALQAIQKHPLHAVDHLCGGNFSRIETLLVAAQTLARPQLRKVAQDQATWVVSRAAAGAYQLFANLPNDVFDPSFFHGTAGIGYGLLRLVNPAAVPSVLLWE
ncbi:type 2 lantipeptide synthetase LanM family protein [Gloeocapsopsis crepidinum LEGE 06123]|uniref:Type 2 lantipeptide synthetase LanM family protein n=1 Tax=Gloeocapsopsis crepidinum LEGE 06123 TaxID=588587 RepID=A0ABR9UYT0_9CHRO|nr:type 2 lanthipeptide synthetase LanM family protein [Gloeocapsopsis crepidinum]MBE9193153.1 type 2 lantipeptide synthetase LanM family protein [Gloeocapsopsis crepidinum LEGE 06123]